MRKFVTFVALAGGWIMLAVATVAIWLHYYSSRGTLALYLTGAVPFALLAGAIGLIIFASLRRWFALALTMVSVGTLCYTQGPLWISQSTPAGERFAVVSANLYFGRADIPQLASVVREADADLVSLQEVTPDALARIRESALAQQLPFEYAIAGPVAAGTVLLSRTRLGAQERIPNMALNNLEATADLPGARSARVLAVHPGAPLSGRSDVWARDMVLLKARLAALPPGPVVVAGDFNASWDHAQYRKLLTDGFADTTEQSGDGYVMTWPTDRFGGRPLVAIDHVIVRGFVASSVHSFSLTGSDHRGVVVSLVAS